MILRTSSGSDREYRMAEFGTSIPPPPGSSLSYDSSWSWAGRMVHAGDALGLSAVAACVRLISSQIALMPFSVYTAEPGLASRTPAPDSWQHALLEDPSGDWDSFTFVEDLVSSLLVCQNAFVQKVKLGPRVVELRPLDPDYVAVRVIDRQKRILWSQAGVQQDVTSSVLHIRGWARKPQPSGTSTIELHANQLGAQLALAEYQGRYFQNDARPGVVLQAPGNLNSDQRADMRKGWAARHQGSPNSHEPAILWNGTVAVPFGSALRDTQAVELNEQALREAARMFGLDPKFVGAEVKPAPATPEADFTRLFRITLLPIGRRIERAFASDGDLFLGSELVPRFDPTEMLRADTATTANTIGVLIQRGVMTANEGRSVLGLPPSSDPKADELLATPVGAGANEPPPPPGAPPQLPPGSAPEGESE